MERIYLIPYTCTFTSTKCTIFSGYTVQILSSISSPISRWSQYFSNMSCVTSKLRIMAIPNRSGSATTGSLIVFLARACVYIANAYASAEDNLSMPRNLIEPNSCIKSLNTNTSYVLSGNRTEALRGL